MIGKEALSQFAKATRQPDKKVAAPSGGFDMEAYLEAHEFKVVQRKPWDGHADGELFLLFECPFYPQHKGGSAAFTLVGGKPGFKCQHDGCKARKIKDVFERFAPAAGDGSDAESEDRSEKGASSALLIELANDAILFRTPDNKAFAAVPIKGHREVWPLASIPFRRWLQGEFYKKFRKGPPRNAIDAAIEQLEARAMFDGDVAQVFTRIAPFGNGIVVDLCNDRWEAVEITVDGWAVVAEPSVYFRRYPHMQPLPAPARGGSLAELRQLINIGDDRNWVLVLAWLAAACRPKGPYPLLIIQGIQGSAKSTTARLLRGLIDPSTCPIRSAPRSEDDLVIAANNSLVLCFDNLSGVQPWFSDALCRVATGGGISKRALFTDSDEVVLDVCRPMILNGIDHLAERADLADRGILLNVPQIDELQRRDEATLFAEYDSVRPGVLGALYDALSSALACVGQVKLQGMPRLADFAIWATAAERGLGLTTGTFMAAYAGNRSEAVQETLDSDAVGDAIQKLMDDQETWQGTSDELLNELSNLVSEAVRKSPKWPKTPRACSGVVRRLMAFLREVQIRVQPPPAKRGTGGRRAWMIERPAPAATVTTVTDVPSNQSNESDEEVEDSDGISNLVTVVERRSEQPSLVGLEPNSLE